MKFLELALFCVAASALPSGFDSTCCNDLQVTSPLGSSSFYTETLQTFAWDSSSCPEGQQITSLSINNTSGNSTLILSTNPPLPVNTGISGEISFIVPNVPTGQYTLKATMHNSQNLCTVSSNAFSLTSASF